MNINQFIKTELKKTLFKISGITSFVSTKWRYTFTPSVILHFSKTGASLIQRFNNMAVQLHTTNNCTCQQNGGTLAYHQQFLKFKVK